VIFQLLCLLRNVFATSFLRACEILRSTISKSKRFLRFAGKLEKCVLVMCVGFQLNDGVLRAGKVKAFGRDCCINRWDANLGPFLSDARIFSIEFYEIQ